MDVDSSELNDCCAELAKRLTVFRMEGVQIALRIEVEGHVIAKRGMKLLGLKREWLKTRGARDWLLGEPFSLHDYDKADDLDTPEGSQAGSDDYLD